MAITYLKAIAGTLPNASNTITVTGENVDFSKTNDYLVAVDNGLYVLPILSGTAPDANGTSTITLTDTWTGVTLTAKGLMVFPTFAKIYESVAAMTALNDITRGVLLKLNNLLTDTTATLPIVVGQTSTITTVPYGYLTAQVTSLINQLNSTVGSIQAMDRAEFDALAEKRISDNAGSGFVEWGYNSDNGVNSGISMWQGDIAALRLGNDSKGIGSNSKTNHSISVVNGVQHQLIRVGVLSSAYFSVSLPPAPNGLQKTDGTADFASISAAIVSGGTALTNSVITRQDLVFLESWHEKLVTHDAVYPLGNVQYGVSTWEAIVLSSTIVAQGYSAFGNWDNATIGYGIKWSTLSAANKTKFIQDSTNNIYSDNGELIQVRYRIRVIKGLGDKWVHSTPLNDAVSAIGYAGPNSYVIARGSNSTAIADFGTPGSLYYLRKHPSSNKKITVQSGLASTEVNFANAHRSLCHMIPIALVSRRNQGAYHPVYNTQGTSALRNADNVSTGGYPWIHSLAKKPLSTSDCFKIASSNSTTAFAVTGGSIAAGISVSKGLGSRFYDGIYAADVQDLRSSARRKTPQELLSYSQKAVVGELRGFESVPFTNAGSYTVTTTGFNGVFTYVNGAAQVGTIGHNIGSKGDYSGNAGILMWVVGNSGAVYQVSFAGTTQLYIKSSYGNVSFDFTANSQVSCVSSLVMQTSKSESPIWTDIIGTPANIAATFPNGVEGQWIPTLPKNTLETYGYNRKNIGTKKVSYTTTNGSAWGADTASWGIGASNSRTWTFASSYVFIISYETKANFLELANNAKVLALGKAVAGNWNDSTIWGAFQESLIGKVATGVFDATNINKNLENYQIQPWANSSLSGVAVYRPTHSPYSLGGASPAVKAFSYITQYSGQYYLQFIYKEIAWNGTSWGDDNKFNILNKEAIVTDNNGTKISAGQKRIKLPFFTGEA